MSERRTTADDVARRIAALVKTSRERPKLSRTAGVATGGQPPAALVNPMTTPYDLIRGGVAGAPVRFAKGADGKILKMVGGALTWSDEQDLVTVVDSSSIDFTLTGQQITASVIAEAIQDIVAAFVVQGSGLTITYNDGANTLTFSASTDTEAVQDIVGAMVVAGTGISATYNDGAGTLTIANTVDTEAIQDIVGAFVVAGSGITVTYSDVGDSLTIASTITQTTQEIVEDWVGALVVAGSGITVTYNDGAGTLTVAATIDTLDELTDVVITSPATGQYLYYDGAHWVNANNDVSLNVVIDGGGAVISTGIKVDLVVDFACTIISWTLLADQSGSIVVDIWKDVYANYPPTVADSITAAAKPTISSATKGQSSSLGTWTTSVAAGDTIRLNVDSVSTCTRVALDLKLRRA